MPSESQPASRTVTIIRQMTRATTNIQHSLNGWRILQPLAKAWRHATARLTTSEGPLATSAPAS